MSFTQPSSTRTLFCLLRPSPITTSYRWSHGHFSLLSGLRYQSSFLFPQFAFSTLYYCPWTWSHLKLPLPCGLHFWLICFCHIFQMNPEWERKQSLFLVYHSVRVLALSGWAWELGFGSRSRIGKRVSCTFVRSFICSLTASVTPVRNLWPWKQFLI